MKKGVLKLRLKYNFTKDQQGKFKYKSGALKRNRENYWKI